MASLIPKITFSNGVSVEFGIDENNLMNLTISGEGIPPGMTLPEITQLDMQRLAQIINAARSVYTAVTSNP